MARIKLSPVQFLGLALLPACDCVWESDGGCKQSYMFETFPCLRFFNSIYPNLLGVCVMALTLWYGSWLFPIVLGPHAWRIPQLFLWQKWVLKLRLLNLPMIPFREIYNPDLHWCTLSRWLWRFFLAILIIPRKWLMVFFFVIPAINILSFKSIW